MSCIHALIQIILQQTILSGNERKLILEAIDNKSGSTEGIYGEGDDAAGTKELAHIEDIVRNQKLYVQGCIHLVPIRWRGKEGNDVWMHLYTFWLGCRMGVQSCISFTNNCRYILITKLKKRRK